VPLSSVIYDRTTLRLQIKCPLSSVIFESEPPEGWGTLCWMQNVTVILMRSMFQLFSMLKDGRKSCHARWGHVIRIIYPQAVQELFCCPFIWMRMLPLLPVQSICTYFPSLKSVLCTQWILCSSENNLFSTYWSANFKAL